LTSPANRALRCLSLFAAPAVLAALSGCSYHSAYVPLDDGRARMVWSENQAVPWTPAPTPECLAHVAQMKQVPVSYLQPLDADPGGGGGGGVIIVGGPGGGAYGRHAWAPRPRGAGSPGGRVGGGGRIGGAGAPRVGGGGHGGGGHGGGGGGDWGKGAIALLVLAYVAVPIGAIVWAADRPESTGVAAGMDEVHAFNDLVRSGDPACGGWQ
jgi:hypothetical protein